MRAFLMICVVALCLGNTAFGADLYATPSNYKTQLNAAQPGDRVLLSPGNYGHLWLSGKSGSPGNLIQVLAQDPQNPPLILNPGNEGWQIYDCSYMLFDGLEMQGAVEEGFHLQGASDHIIMRNCKVTMQSASGNTDCFKSDQTTDTLFYNCEARQCGDCGFDHVGAQQTLIMRSYMKNNGNSGIHAKNSSHDFGFYRNVFDHAGERNFQFGSNGEYSYDQVAMGNVLIGGHYSVAYTTVRDCDFAYNTSVDPLVSVIRMLNENPGGGVTTAYNSFTNNISEYTSYTWQTGPNTEPETFTFADNVWSKTPSLPAPETGTQVLIPILDDEHRPLHPLAKNYGAHAPGMEEAFLEYTDRFAWSWSYAEQYDPDADAGGEYVVYRHGEEGGDLHLDGSGSYAGDNPNADLPNYNQNVISLYNWDIDGNNVFGDESGAQPVLSFADLAAYGLDVNGEHMLELAITATTDWGEMKDWDTTFLTIADAPLCDATFDGTVNADDLATLGLHWSPGASGMTWSAGDFDGNGSVDAEDLAMLGLNWAPGGTIPEPCTLVMLSLAGIAGLYRRR